MTTSGFTGTSWPTPEGSPSEDQGSDFSNETIRLRMVREILGPQVASAPPGWVQLGVEGMDDAALLRLSDTHSLVVASDFVRGSSFYLFRSGHMGYRDVGRYLMGANLSDVAAMGARPIAATTVIRYAETMDDDGFRQVISGIREAAETHGVAIIGGDIGGHSSDVFAATVLGIVETDKALRRSTARPGDLLCVTGVVGRPMTAMLYFLRAQPAGCRLDPVAEEELLVSWRRPCPRLDAGVLLSGHRLATACMDISDGLRASVEQLARASGIGFTVHAEQVPLHPATEVVAAALGADPLHIAWSASVDFELLFTMPPEREPQARSLFAEAGLPLHVIGRAVASEGNRCRYADGHTGPLPGLGWEHQLTDLLAEVLAFARL